MYVYKTLKGVDIDLIYGVFIEAFSVYTMKPSLLFEKFKNMVIRVGYSPEFSVGAFHKNRLIGFVLNGVRNWNEKMTAYDCGTGVVLEHRKQGVTNAIMADVMQILKDNEIEQYVLEVIKVNKPAVELYRKHGFSVSRTYSCFRGKNEGINKVPESFCEYMESDAGLIEWGKVRSFWDFEPSWQNSIESVLAVPWSFHVVTALVDKKIVGYGMIDRKTGNIPQIAVHPDHRSRGIGRNLLSRLIIGTASPNVELINIDDKCHSLKDFLRNLGIENFAAQYEMLLKIQP